MLGARTAWELALALGAGCPLPRAAGCADGPAIEYGPAALNSRTGGGRCGRRSDRHNGSLVDGPGTGLRHDNSTRGRRRLHRGRLRRSLGDRLSCERDGLFCRCHVGKLCLEARRRFVNRQRRRNFLYSRRGSNDRNGGSFHGRRGRWSRCRSRRTGRCNRRRSNSNRRRRRRSLDLRLGRRSNRFRSGWSFCSARRSSRSDRRLDHRDGLGRHHRDGGTRGRCGSGGSLGDHGSRWRLGGDGRRRRRRGDDLRRLPDGGHNPARLGTRGSGGWMSHRYHRWRGLGRRLRLRRGRRPNRSVASARRRFVLLLLGQNCLERIAGLGDVRKVNLGLNGLRRPRRSCPRMGSRPSPALKLCAHPIGFIRLQGAGVRLAFTKAELRQYVENLATLDFHLACEIVDSYLTHPPLFTLCYPKP